MFFIIQLSRKDKHLRSVLSCFFAEKCRLPCLNDAWVCSGADRYVARCGLYCGFSWTGVQPRAGNFSFLELDAGHKKVMPTSTDARRHDTEIGGWLTRPYGRT